MTRLNFKNKAVLFLAMTAVLFPLSAHALLQVNQTVLIGDYDSQTWKGESSGGCTPHLVTGEEAFGGRGASLVLDYDVRERGSFSYFLIRLEEENLMGMRYLSFWMRGNPGAPPPQFFVELHEDTNGDKRYVLGRDQADRILISSLKGRADRGGWQKVVIPLSRFHRIRRWDRILEIVIVFENKSHIGKGSLFLDDLLFGSNYPEGLEGREIPMQNRVSSFKIDNQIAGPEMKLKPKPTPLTLTLTFIDPYLEEIRFEESRDGGKSWFRDKSFYDHSAGGVYEYELPWDKQREVSFKEGISIRAVGVSLFGGETELAGPYHIRFD